MNQNTNKKIMGEIETQIKETIENNEPFKEPISNITGNKILIISDTHLGNEEKEKLELLENAYNRAIKAGIKNALHLGDLTDGVAYRQDSGYNRMSFEFCQAINFLPEEIKTNLLLGNHEYYTIDRYNSFLRAYFTNPKLNTLGIKSALINWNNLITMRLYHEIKEITIIENSKQSDLELKGHEHSFSYQTDSKIIKLPCLATITNDNNLLNYGLTINRLAYFIMSQEDSETILFRGYSTQDKDFNELTFNTKTKILKKL